MPLTTMGVPSTKGLPAVRSFSQGTAGLMLESAQLIYRITGVTRDSNGAPLGFCTVKLFRTADDTLYGTTVSDGNGAYTMFVNNLYTYYAVAYLDSIPAAGTTLNTLTGS